MITSLMRILNILFLLLFVVSALLQYNDPDPEIWMPIYFYGAAICAMAIAKKFFKIMYVVGLAVYIPYAAYLLLCYNGVITWIDEHHAENISQTMKATTPWIENTREFFGLLLLITALVANWYWLNRMYFINKNNKTIYSS